MVTSLVGAVTWNGARSASASARSSTLGPTGGSAHEWSRHPSLTRFVTVGMLTPTGAMKYVPGSSGANGSISMTSRTDGVELGVGAELGVRVGVDGGLSVGFVVAPGAELPQPETMPTTSAMARVARATARAASVKWVAVTLVSTLAPPVRSARQAVSRRKG